MSRQARIVTIISIASLMTLAGYQVLIQPESDRQQITSSHTPQPTPFQRPTDDQETYFKLENSLIAETNAHIRSIDTELVRLRTDENFGALRDKLLELASNAVGSGQHHDLAKILSLLGQISIDEQDLDGAEVYLMEALAVFEQLGDEIGSASTYMQLGRTHLKSRQLARTAGKAYDLLQIARWQLQDGQISKAEENLKQVIESNLSVQRFGAAASAYTSLAKLYQKTGDQFQSEETAMKAAELYAASGQRTKADNIVNRLLDAGISTWRADQITQLIEKKYQQYQDNIKQVAQAQDYQRLYYHYRAAGDTERAWTFRLLANQSLSKIPKRAMYYRQADVLAVLYNSNSSMNLAENYFTKARSTFVSHGLSELTQQTDTLEQQVF